MRTLLYADVDLAWVTACAEVGVYEKRPDMQWLCAAATGGVLDVAGIAAALPGLSDTASKNLLRTCKYLALCDDSGRLSADGHDCVKTGVAGIPEQGLYAFLLARHPAIGTRVLHWTPIESDDRTGSVAQVGDDLRDVLGRSWTGLPFAADVRIRKVFAARQAPPLGRFDKVRGDCALVWEIDFSAGTCERRLEATVDAGEITAAKGKGFVMPLAPLGAPVVAALMSHWDPRWHSTSGRLGMVYDGAADAREGRDDFLRQIDYGQVEIPGESHFRDVSVDDVPVGPTDAAGAQDWAAQLLVAQILASDTYLTLDDARGLHDDLVAGSPLERFSPRPPPSDYLLGALAALADPIAAAAFWRFAAPLDVPMPTTRTP